MTPYQVEQGYYTVGDLGSYDTEAGYYTVGGTLGEGTTMDKIMEYKWYILGGAVLAGGIWYLRKRKSSLGCGCY